MIFERHRVDGTAWGLLDRFGGLLVALVAVIPRARGLGEWWLNPDEGTYFAIATRTSGAWREIMENAHPPLYYLLLRVLGVLTHDFFWFRMLSLVFGVAAVYAAWLAARELAGEGVRRTVGGLVAASIVAFAPGAVELSQVIRPYTLQLALLSASLFFLLRYLDTRSVQALAGYAGLVGLALLTHYSSMLALGAFGVLVVQQGLAQRWGAADWRRIAVAHAVPGAVFLGLYLFHLRALVGTTLSDAALDGWLSFYMVRSPGEAWVAFVGFLRLVGYPWLVGPLALFVLAAAGRSAASRDRRPVTLAASGLGLALVGAAAGLYPFGPTRHSLWLMAILVPVLGWLAAEIVSLPRRTAALAVALVATLLLTGETAGRWLGVPRTPGAAPDRVLRTADVERMADVLDADGRPRLVVTSRQTFYLLLPLYPPGWEEADVAADSAAVRFRMGERHVVAAKGWELRAVEGVGGDSSFLLDVLRTAERDFAGLESQSDSTALVLAGGWELAVLADLRALSGTEPVVLGLREVPGLLAIELDLDAYRRAVAGAPAGAR